MNKASYKGQFGKISVSVNEESEFKVGFFFADELNVMQAQGHQRDEARLAMVGKEVWDAYLLHRYEFERKQDVGLEPLILANGITIPSFHQEQNKERRLRSFFMMAHDHPYDLEARVEYRDGKKITMLKKGNGANEGKPIIHRKEVKIVSDIREKTEDILRELPRHFQRVMGFEFNRHNRLYEPMQTNSMRLKTKVRVLVRETAVGPLAFVVEPALDLGSGLVVTGDRWPLREFEDEVKGVYRLGDDMDIKANPEEAGIDPKDMDRLCIDVLKPEREDYMAFAQLYLLEKARENPERYGDIEIAGVYDSKSMPGRRILKDRIEEGSNLRRLMRCPKTGGIKTLDWQESLIPALAA